MGEAKELFLNVDFGENDFNGRSVENGLPVTSPLHDLEDLLAWKPDDSEDAGQIFSISTVPYLGKEIPKDSTKTLVCHDMAGGYLNDRFVQGSVCTDDKWYYLAYWDIVDTFVYFSHHFVTIPPVGWINGAHNNGVAVLGTFITESLEGKTRCEAIFSHELMWKTVANQLVEIAKYYRFEGWLLNIENEISKANTENLKNFVKYLSDQMHDAIEGSQVIWYDSVTEDGTLEWQNKLNSKNSVYFNACDGIFLNYSWSEEGLEESAALALKTERLSDVYVGIDVFGRGCYGGGGMNVSAAMEVLRKHNLSAAIFAPGWVKEALGSKDFEKQQQNFWTNLHSLCNSHNVLCDNEQSYLSSDFHTGMSLQGETRFLHINRQNQMPSLSEEQFLPLKLTAFNKQYVGIEKDSTVLIYKTGFTVKSQHFAIYIKAFGSYANITPEVLGRNEELFIGDEEEKRLCHARVKRQQWYHECEKQVGSKNHCWIYSVPTTPFTICELRCRVDGDASYLEKIVVVDVDTGLNLHSAFSYEHIRYRKEQALEKQLTIDIALENVSWSKSEEKDDVYLLSCTLDLSNTDESLPCCLSFRTVNTKYADLGWFLCRKFRIDKLSVPSPVYHGPSVKVFIRAEQISPVPFLPDLFPSCYGEIAIKYAENIRQ